MVPWRLATALQLTTACLFLTHHWMQDRRRRRHFQVRWRQQPQQRQPAQRPRERWLTG